MKSALAYLLIPVWIGVHAIGSPSPTSPWEMAAETERWLVEGAGARFPIGMVGPAREADSVVFVDDAWPLPFQDRIGEEITMRVSPDTGCYEFVDGDDIVFWTVVPAVPLTWDWVSSFRSPDRPDTQGLYSPFRLAREWSLLSHAESAENEESSGRANSPSEPPCFGSHAEFAENAEFPNAGAAGFERARRALGTTGGAGLRTPAQPASDTLCITSFHFSETNLLLTASWPTNDVLPEGVLDLYGAFDLHSRYWTLLSSHPATNPPVSFAVERASLPWFDGTPPHVHDATCLVSTNVVLSPFDGATVYTNVVWSCSTNHPPGETGFFRLGTRADTDGDGLTDAFELLAAGSDPDEPDTDLDGLLDDEEFALDTDPLSADTDGDGMSDEEEILSGCNPLVPGLPVGATIRYVHDDDDRLVGAFPGGSPAADVIRWSSAGDPIRSRERGAQ